MQIKPFYLNFILQTMNFDNTDKDWMDEAPKLAAMDRKNPFSVPPDYFEALSGEINSRITAANFTAYSPAAFSVPENYFEELPREIETRISLENIRALAVADGFTVPEGYFANLEEKTLGQSKVVGSSKVRKLFPAWINYAAAACLTFVLGTVLYMNLRNNRLESRLNSIPEQEIVNYLQVNTDLGDTPTIIENLEQNASLNNLGQDIPAQDLEQYIDNTF